ncbi:hypothetical protein A0256_18720 [Mucilaginibacter sp. PAMC 26640]|nr:hypothetical protein A0256_18720 [Mucilaginibacter sp. PAMC 26640]
MQKIKYALVLFTVVAIAGCKKSNPSTTGDTTGDQPSKTGSTLDLIRDSVYLYAKETYYWNDALPTYSVFKPRSFTASDDVTALTSELDALSQYKINPVTSRPYEYYSAAPGSAKYSFIDDGSVSSQLNGVNGDFGFAPIYIDLNDLRVRYVYPGSPADLAGIKRGYQITSINGRTNLTYDGDGGSGANVKYVVNAYAESSNITMILKKPDGSALTVNLNVANYTVNPVIATQVFDQSNGHKVGYIAFNTFTSKANAKPKLDAAFANFAAKGITDLVVDLRYNGGGYVETAEYLSDLIAPASKNGSVMFTAFYNSILSSNKSTLLKNQVRRDPEDNSLYNYSQIDYSAAAQTTHFSKTGVPVSLTLGHVFFIVTGSTASASELTINNLRPVMDVQLIGTTSYGKPVGFFDIDINKYQMYTPNFETKNSAGQGGYYSGMTPGSTDYKGFRASDDVTKEFGDPTEGLLAHALNFVKNGTFTVSGQVIQSAGKVKTMSIDESHDAGIQLDGNKFNGMLYKNPRIKK